MYNNFGNFNNEANIQPNPVKLDFKKIKGPIKTIALVIGLLIILNIIFNSFFFVVEQREQVIVRQFNEVVKIVVDEDSPELRESLDSVPQLRNVDVLVGKGLFFKIPFIQTTESFKSLLLTYDTNKREVITRDKKKLVLDNYAQWRIKNPALFAISLKNERAAHTRLDDIIYSKLNEEIGKVDAHVVIADKDYMYNMLQKVTADINQLMQKSGVEVVDIRIKRTDLPPENYNNIYNRMKTERERAAKTYRSEGKEEAQKIRSEADREATVIEAKAYEEAEKIKGEGDAEALRIYAEAYNKDPEFYSFYRTLQAYKKALKDKTKIVIDPESEFAKYLFKN